MRLFSLHRRTLMISVMLASFPLSAQTQGKERPVEHPTFYRTEFSRPVESG